MLDTRLKETPLLSNQKSWGEILEVSPPPRSRGTQKRDSPEPQFNSFCAKEVIKNTTEQEKALKEFCLTRRQGSRRRLDQIGIDQVGRVNKAAIIDGRPWNGLDNFVYFRGGSMKQLWTICFYLMHLELWCSTVLLFHPHFTTTITQIRSTKKETMLE